MKTIDIQAGPKAMEILMDEGLVLYPHFYGHLKGGITGQRLPGEAERWAGSFWD